ncbi:hypothetical protein J7L05_00950 [bacterium]|nr:hypothetical protein [bacterium]
MLVRNILVVNHALFKRFLDDNIHHLRLGDHPHFNEDYSFDEVSKEQYSIVERVPI